MNKKLYNTAYTYKTEIEATIDTTVLWDSGDDKKSSRVYVELKGVSINNEIVWPRTKKFHAE